jgi:Zn-dependent protease with chaperone function
MYVGWLELNIYVYKADVPNAAATTLTSGMPVILYNITFLNNLSYANTWAPISVLAHEVGHHYNADISWFGQFVHPWTRELKADYVSGYALFKLGATIDDAQAAFRVMFTLQGSESHPDTPKRMEALAAGYLRASLGY